MNSKPILISGIQPTGPLHIGNYLGALKNFVELQNSGKYKCLFFIADLHSLTENPQAEELRNNIIVLTKEIVAAGINPKTTTIFQQSMIHEHSELMYLLTTLTPEGDLRRMTQYKDKVLIKEYEENMGLLTYPIMMAADIMLYNAKHVPVGEDQKQHLEFTRRMVRRFNNAYGETFVEPKELLAKTPRIMSLDDPDKKMSKSRPAGCIFLNDSEEDLKKKVMKATTDSGNEIKYNPEKKSAISNLLSIYSEISEIEIKKVEEKFKDKSYKILKEELAGILIDKMKTFRETSLKNNQIKKILKKGSKKAQKTAKNTMEEVKEKIGLVL